MSLTATGVVTNASGQATTDGAIVLTVTGGTSPYTYSWSNGSTSKDISSLAAARYRVTVTDNVSATTTYTGTVHAALKIYYKFSSSSDITTDSSTTGATLSGSGGSPYNDGTRGYVAQFAGGGSDRYSTSITGFNQATSHSASLWLKLTSWPTNITNLFQLGGNAGSNRWQILLDPTQYRIANVSGGTGVSVIKSGTFSTGAWHHLAATYDGATGLHTLYLDGTSVATTTQSMPSLACDTFYVANSFNFSQPLTGYMSRLCLFNSLLTSDDITSLANETISTSTSVSGSTLSLTASGGIAPVLYSWNTGDITQNLTSVSVGNTYICSITDALGVTGTASRAVTDPDITISYSATAVTSYGGSDGAITVTPSGGTGSFAYSWSDGPTTADRSSLSGGSYTVTVTSGTATPASQTIVVAQPLYVTYTQTNVASYGGSTGAIDVTVAGGTGSYTYAWSDGSVTTQDRTSLAAGSYTVTVTSGSFTATQAVTLLQGIQITYVTTNVSAYAQADGAINVSVAGGTGSYTYAWSDGSVTTQDRTSLGPGSYTVTVTSGSFSNSSSITVTQPSLAFASGSALGTASGVVDDALFDSTRQYFFYINNGQTVIIRLSDFAAFTNTNSGWRHRLDASNGVIYSAFNTTGTPWAIYRTDYTNLSSLTKTTIHTAGAAPAWMVHSAADNCIYYATTSGVNMYKVASALTASNASATTVYTGLPSAVYQTAALVGSKIICHENNSTAMMIIDISDIGNVTHSTYTGRSGGVRSLSAHPSGNYLFALGRSSSTVSYWNTNTAFSSWTSVGGITNCQAIAFDTSNNTAVASSSASAITRTGNDPFAAMTISFTPQDSTGSDGSIAVSVTGGYSPYTYSWNNGATTRDISGLANGTYTLSVTDAIGLVKTGSSTVGSAGTEIVLSESHTNASAYGSSDGSIDVSVSGGIGTYAYSWSDGSVTTQDRTSLAAGSYTVTVTSGSFTASQSVTIRQPLHVTYTSADASTYGSSDGSIDVTVAGGTGSYAYSWSDGSVTTQDRTSLAAGSYTVTVTSGSFTASQSVTISQPSAVTVATTPVAADVSWVAVVGAVYYRVTYQASGGAETIGKNDITTTSGRLLDLEASTAYSVKVYSRASVNVPYALQYTTSATTPAGSAVSYDKSFFEISSGTYSVTSLSGTALSAIIQVIGSVLATGDKLRLTLVYGTDTQRVLTPTVVKLGESVDVSSVDSVYIPFTSSGGSSQTSTLVLSDSTTTDVVYDEGSGSVTVGGITRAVGDVFILDGKKVTIREV